MAPQSRNKAKKDSGIDPQVIHKMEEMISQMNALKLRSLIDATQRNNLKSDKHEAKRVIKHLKEQINANKGEAKLATCCVNTQYKLLQRLFMLRVHESKESIARLKKENNDLKAECARIQAEKNELVNEKDEQIARLEAHLQSLHFQLERVVIEMMEKLERRLESDWVQWEEQATDLHKSSKKLMEKLGFGSNFL